MKTLKYDLNQFIHARIESEIWETLGKVKDYDKDEDIITKNTTVIRKYFNENKELDKMFCDLLDSYCNQLVNTQVAAYKLGLEDGLNFKKALANI